MNSFHCYARSSLKMDSFLVMKITTTAATVVVMLALETLHCNQLTMQDPS